MDIKQLQTINKLLYKQFKTSIGFIIYHLGTKDIYNITYNNLLDIIDIKTNKKKINNIIDLIKLELNITKYHLTSNNKKLLQLSLFHLIELIELLAYNL